MKKIAVITGGAKGIGRGIAERLRQSDYTVIIGDIDQKCGEETAREVGIEYSYVDVTDCQSVADFLAKIVANGEKIDVLVINVGKNDGLSTAKTSPLQWNEAVQLNLNSAFYTLKTSLDHLADGGRIIFISSLVGVIGEANTAAYAAAKGGIIAYVRSLALELAPRKITVNSIAPGDVDTPLYAEWLKTQPPGTLEEAIKQIPLKRLAEPEEIGALVAYLVSPDSSFLTGQTIVIDGGRSLGK